MTPIWMILALASAILLIVHWNKNVVWGAFTLGIIIGIMGVIFSDVSWYFILKSGIIGVVSGFLLELIPTSDNHAKSINK